MRMVPDHLADMMIAHRQDIADFAAATIENLGFGIVIVEADSHKVVYLNQKALAMSGFSMDAILGQTCHHLLCPAEAGKCPISDLGQSVDNSERKMLCADASKLSIIKSVVSLKYKDKEYLIESLIDNSERKAMQNQLTHSNQYLQQEIQKRIETQDKIHHLAYHDHLTGLPNRLHFNDQLNHAIQQAIQSNHILAVMFLDLDIFKMVNDTMGHDAGDQLLKVVSERLVKTLRKTDIIARLGGDEFIILIDHAENIQEICGIAESILDSFRESFQLHGKECFLTTSIGIALYPDDGQDNETLLKNADIAMYRAKEKGKNQYVICSPVMKSSVTENMNLANDLYRAMERNELELYYQPQVSCSSNYIVGAEALLRWHHPELGTLSPSKFIPIAEQTGLIIPIGEWVLRSACTQNKRWHNAGYSKLRVGVNLSVKQFQNHTQLLRQVEDILKDTGLAPEYLELELTESIAMKEKSHVAETLNILKNHGIRIAIDDFGMEYSSLSYLKHLPIDTIKIAMPFVQGIEVSNVDEAITKAVIVLAKSMGKGIIAEGVETESQMVFLTQRMCDEIQGFHYFKPMPVDQMEELLKKEKETCAASKCV